jgi:hypothetical protein
MTFQCGDDLAPVAPHDVNYQGENEAENGESKSGCEHRAILVIAFDPTNVPLMFLSRQAFSFAQCSKLRA